MELPVLRYPFLLKKIALADFGVTKEAFHVYMSIHVWINGSIISKERKRSGRSKAPLPMWL